MFSRPGDKATNSGLEFDPGGREWGDRPSSLSFFKVTSSKWTGKVFVAAAGRGDGVTER